MTKMTKMTNFKVKITPRGKKHLESKKKKGDVWDKEYALLNFLSHSREETTTTEKIGPLEIRMESEGKVEILHKLPSSFIEDKKWDTRPTQVVSQWVSQALPTAPTAIQSWAEYEAQLRLVGKGARLAWAGLLVGAIAQLPVCLHGPPGTGKSLIADQFISLFPNKTGITLSPSVLLSEVFGPPSIEGFQQGVTARDVGASPLGGHLVLLNELDKADGEVIQGLYDFLNEGIVREGSRTFRFDHRLAVVATVNGPLLDKACEDRFPINAVLAPPSSHRWWLEAREREGADAALSGFFTPERINRARAKKKQNIKLLREQPVNTKNPDNAASAFAVIIDKVIENGIALSGRKIMQWEEVVAAWAAIQSREVQPLDCAAIQLSFFNIEERQKVLDIVEKAFCISNAHPSFWGRVSERSPEELVLL